MLAVVRTRAARCVPLYRNSVLGCFILSSLSQCAVRLPTLNVAFGAYLPSSLFDAENRQKCSSGVEVSRETTMEPIMSSYAVLPPNSVAVSRWPRPVSHADLLLGGCQLVVP